LVLLAVCLPAGIGLLHADAASDERIKQRIKNKLSGQVSLHLESLELDVRDGAVRLAGSVASVGERAIIERLVGGLSGVTGITNDLSVRPTGRSEQAIADEVRRLLERRVRFKKSPIDVTASGSDVTLDGTIERAIDRLDAEVIAGGVTGVTRVINNLQVVPSGQTSPQTIRERILSALGNPLTFGVIRDLEVVVDGGAVELRGVAVRDADRTQAERLALGVNGVISVKNLITVARP
jgi:osmotically-inducible protein OsmY